jgi:energy-converting hydrogenase Eha subunit H
MSNDNKFSIKEIEEYSKKIWQDLNATFEKSLFEVVDETGTAPFAAICDGIFNFTIENFLIAAHMCDNLDKDRLLKTIGAFHKSFAHHIETINENIENKCH